MIPMRFLALLATLAVMATTLPVQGQASTREQARQSFARGVEAYQAGRHAEAVEAFEEAYRLAPHPSVLANIANAYEQLGQKEEALAHFERFLAEAKGAPAKQKREVRRAVDRLRRALEDDRREAEAAAVRAEAAAAAREPAVSAAAEASSTPAASTDEPPAEDEDTPAVTAPPAAPTPNETEPAGADVLAEVPPRHGDREDAGPGIPTGAWIAGAATFAVGAAAVATGVMALNADDDFDADATRFERTGAPADRERAADSADRANRLALTTDVLIGATVAGAVTTTLLLVLGGGDTAERSPSAGLRASPTFTAGGGGVVLRGEL